MTVKPWVWWAVVVLAILHQDFWLWDDATLVFGFMPVGLAWHAGFSLAAGLLWLVVAQVAWPFPDDPAPPDADATPPRGPA